MKHERLGLINQKMQFFSGSDFADSCACAMPVWQHTNGVHSFFPIVACSSLFCLGCVKLGPDHQAPTLDLPSQYSQKGVSWKRTSPPQVYTHSTWWKVYGDRTLDQLAQATAEQNLSIQAAASRLKEARSLSRATRTTMLPSLDFNGDLQRTTVNFFGGLAQNRLDIFQLPIDLAYEVDLWGRVRRNVESADAQAASAEATVVATKLSLTADTALTYWSLRALDAEKAQVEKSIDLRKESLALNEARFRAGTANELDASRAKTELATVESENIGLEKKRAELLNALAVLTGKPAGTLQIAPQATLPTPPKIPAGVPSDLLLRRPDLYAAERNVAAANAQIGVAKAAFFPSLRLRAGTGTNATQLGDLFDADAVAWSLGTSLTYPIIGQARIRADYQAAKARHETASLDYKQAGLIAMRETEDSLTGLSFLEKQEQSQQQAADAAKQTLKLSRQRYEAGLTNYLEVVEAERTLLQSERLVTSLRAQRLALTTQLIKALGGAW